MKKSKTNVIRTFLDKDVMNNIYVQYGEYTDGYVQFAIFTERGKFVLSQIYADPFVADDTRHMKKELRKVDTLIKHLNAYRDTIKDLIDAE